MSLIQLVAETQTYFIDNWTDTPLKIDDVPNPFNGAINDEYIEVKYVPEDNKCLMGRVTSFGTLQVQCYNKSKIKAVLLADKVKDFISEKDLPQRIRVNYGDDVMITELDNNYWLVVLHFPVSQF